MTYTVIGIFDDTSKAEAAITELEHEGFNPKDMSIVMRDTKAATTKDTGDNVAEGTVSGMTTGAVVGGIAGLVGAIVLPGLGAFLLGGPIATALGLTGAAAATASGVATGAVAGGFLGALGGLGLSNEDAKYYEQRITEGGVLVAVPASESTSPEAEAILERFDATDVKSVNTTQK